VHGLARSGGTLLSRCLGCMDGVMLLSEVHPTVPSPFSVVDQAREWYGVVVPRGLDFLSQVDLMVRDAAARGSSLVLRDWSHVDFVSCDEPGWNPINFSLLRSVLGSRYDVCCVSLVRNFEDTWSSMLKFPGTSPGIVNGSITLGGFRKAHDSFGKFVRLTGSISYEDLCADPDVTMRKVCEHLDMPFDPTYDQKWSSYRKVTGDTASFGRIKISRI